MPMKVREIVKMRDSGTVVLMPMKVREIVKMKAGLK
jgi:hypothetical protein